MSLQFSGNETNFRKDIVATVKANFGKHLPVMNTVIPATVRLAEISTEDKSIFQHEPRGRAAEAYRSLTKEVLEIGHKERRSPYYANSKGKSFTVSKN